MLQIVEWNGFDRSNSVFIADHGRFKSVKISTRERGNTTRVRHEFRFIGHCIFAAGSESILSIKTRFKPGFLVPPPPHPHPSPLHSITISLQNSTPFAVAFICNNIRQYLSNVSHQRNLSRAITTSLLFTDINSTGKHGKINIYRPIFPFEQRRNNYQDVVEQ